MASKSVSETHPKEYAWLQNVDPLVFEQVEAALISMNRHGTCDITPAIISALDVLGVLDKSRSALDALELIEAMA